MKLSDVNNFKDSVPNVLFQDLTSDNNVQLSGNDAGKSYIMTFDGSCFHIKCNGVNRILKLPNQRRTDISDLFKKGITIVSELIWFDLKKSHVCMNIYPFYDCMELGDVYVGVSNEIKEKLKANKLIYSFDNNNDDNPKDKKRHLFSELFSITIDDQPYFLFKSPDDRDFNYVDQYELNKEKKKEEKSLVNEETVKEDNQDIPDFLKDVLVPPEIVIANKMEEEHRAFTIVGKDLRTPIQIIKDDNLLEDTKLHVKQVIFKNEKNSERYGLVHGSIYFIDDSLSYKRSSQIAATISELYKKGDSYLSKWDQYCQYEMKQTLRTCRSFGYAKIIDVEPTLNGYIIGLDKEVDIEGCVDGDEIIINDNLPLLLNSSQKLSDSEHTSSSGDDINELLEDYKQINKQTGGRYQLIKSESKRHVQLLKIKCTASDAKPQKGSFVFLSITGNLKQQKRREYARKLIASKQCGNPYLGVLLEDNESLDLQICHQKRVEKRIKPLSERIQNKIFSKNPPTSTQIEAIDIAINTPDIALIQGPPGTGKTTVITAIIERLNELSDKSSSIKGRILVSGFQHDAVENIIDRLSINSLPVVKFGSKRGFSDNDSATMHRVENWANDIAEKIRKHNPTIQETEEEKEWEVLYNEYLVSPSENNEIKILNTIINSRNSNVRQSSLVEEAKQLLKKYSSYESDELYEIRHAINCIRTKKNSYVDDGVDNCVRLLVLSEQYRDLFDLTDVEILKRSWSVSEDELPTFLTELEQLKQRLQYRVLPKPEYAREKINHNIVDISQRMRNLLKNRSSNGKNEENQILVDFLSVLENNSVGIRKAIEDYQLVYSATTQQSLSKSILEAKASEDGEYSLPLYDTVIIDEAARANPSDLLIPMVQAEKRIILVGDHRQLPHMIDETIIDSIENNEEFDPNIYKVSMFEYLFHRLQKLESHDGIKRTVTLDAQYRTHPTLGRFASKMFYESHDASEAYTSPLTKEFFKQELVAIPNLCCSWFDVPNANNPMEKNSSGSSYRVSEAEVCARCIKNWIDSPQGEKLSFGIITFYSAQVLEIMKYLEKYEVAESDLNGGYKIRENYQYLSNGKERLRVGSVDAFQGMEFDIVLLSIVRTKSSEEVKHALSSAKDKEKAANKIVGFLRMENRLCVSMSRQKRFLGIVGDANFINMDVCKQYVPSLAEFYKLCQLEGKIIRC